MLFVIWSEAKDPLRQSSCCSKKRQPQVLRFAQDDSCSLERCSAGSNPRAGFGLQAAEAPGAVTSSSASERCRTTIQRSEKTADPRRKLLRLLLVRHVPQPRQQIKLRAQHSLQRLP